MADNLEILIKSIYDATGVKVAESDLQKLVAAQQAFATESGRAAKQFIADKMAAEQAYAKDAIDGMRAVAQDEKASAADRIAAIQLIAEARRNAAGGSGERDLISLGERQSITAIEQGESAKRLAIFQAEEKKRVDLLNATTLANKTMMETRQRDTGAALQAIYIDEKRSVDQRIAALQALGRARMAAVGTSGERQLLAVQTQQAVEQLQMAAKGFTGSRREFMMGQRLQGLITGTLGIDSGLTRTLDGFERLQFMAQASNMTVGAMLLKFGPMAVAVASVAAVWKVATGELERTNKTLSDMGLKQIGFLQMLKLGVTGDTSMLKVDGEKAYARAVKASAAELDIAAIASKRIEASGTKSLSAQIEIVRQTRQEVDEKQHLIELQKQLNEEMGKPMPERGGAPSTSEEIEARITKVGARVRAFKAPVTGESVDDNGVIRSTSLADVQRANEQQARDQIELAKLQREFITAKEREDKESSRAAITDAEAVREAKQKTMRDLRQEEEKDASQRARENENLLQQTISDESAGLKERARAVRDFYALKRAEQISDAGRQAVDIEERKALDALKAKTEKAPDKLELPRALEVQTDQLARIGLLVGGQSPLAGDNQAKRSADALEKITRDGVKIKNPNGDWVQ